MAPAFDQPLTPQESELEVFQACLRTIEAKAAYNDVKSRLDGLEEHYIKEKAEKNRLQEELTLVRAQLNSAVVALEAHHQAEETPEVTSSSAKGKEKEVVPEDDDEIEYVEEEWSDVGGPEADPPGAAPTQMSPPPTQMSPPPIQMSPPPAPIPQDPDEPSSSTGPAPVINSFDKDAEMAAALQLEFMEEDRLLAERFSQLLSPTQNTFDCASCHQRYSEDEVVVLPRCHHAFCKPCLAKHVRQKIKDLRFPVVCLICAAERTVADPGRGVVTREIVLKLDFSPDNMKRWTELEFASLRVVAECRRCKASVIVDRGDLQPGKFVDCPTRSCQNMWSKALIPRGTRYGTPSFKDFSHLLDKLQGKSKKAKRSAAAILTKPPEIFAIFAIQVPADKARSTPSTTVFAIFDSHSRPGRHAHGAAITFFGTSTGAATYLEELLVVDEALTSSPQLDWQTELLSQFSAHFLVASETEHSMTPREAELELFQASIRTLELKAELDRMKSSMEDLQEKYSREKAERRRVEDELAVVRAELRSVREGEARRPAGFKPLATPPSSKGKEKA
ncbi:hypothetical protein FRC00_010345, partial [Tulasnella sp. 408]